MSERIRIFLLFSCLFVNSVACSISSKPTEFKTPMQQLLISKAIERSMRVANPDIQPGMSVSIDTSGLTKDQEFLGDILAGKLGSQGLVVHGDPNGLSDIRVQVIVQSLGTRKGVKFLGLPPNQSVLLPFALPELAIWKREKQQGYARFYLDLFDGETGEFLRSTEPYSGSVTETKYTLLFFIDWKQSDLDQPLDLF